MPSCSLGLGFFLLSSFFCLVASTVFSCKKFYTEFARVDYPYYNFENNTCTGTRTYVTFNTRAAVFVTIEGFGGRRAAYLLYLFHLIFLKDN
jgi:hypothetical protein